MGEYENMTFFLGFGIYFVLSILLVLRVAPVWLYRLFASLILVFEGVAIGLRWASTGHPPILGVFEESLSASWVLTFFTLVFDSRRRFAFITIPFAFLTLFYGLGSDLSGRPLIISEQSWWVYFHVLFAWIAYGFYTLSFCASLCITLKKRFRRFAACEPLAARFIHNGLLSGFIAQTVMFVLGSFYSTRLHGAWWMWDPVEFLFIVSWFLFAIAIHGRLFYGWRNERVSAWIMAAFLATLILYWGLVFFPWSTYHIFEPEIKSHFYNIF